MQALIYSNGSQECERAKMLLEAVHEDTKEFLLDTDFTDKQFRAEFGDDAEYPQIALRSSPSWNAEGDYPVHVQ